MSHIGEWIAKQSALEEKIPSLIDSILRKDLFRYVRYRLKFLSVRIVAEMLTTMVEFIFFFYLLKRSDVQIILVAKISTIVAEAWLWGALELPRTRIRNLMDDGRRVKVRIEIRDWLLFSAVVSVVLVFVSLGYLAYAGISSTGLTYVEFYIFASMLKISFDVFTRTFHSCVYAVTRIFRPLFIVVFLQLLLFSGSLVAWNYLGFWALPMTQFIVSVLLSAITIYYTRLQYLRLRLPKDKLITAPEFPKIKLKEYGFASLTSITNTLLKFESLLVLVLLRSGQNNSALVNLALFFFLISPLLKGSFDWARLFYFDYKRLEVGIFSNFRDMFNRYLNMTALAMAVICWAISALVGVFIFELTQAYFILSLLLVFVFRSLLGSYQIRAFSNSRYIELLVSESVFISGLVLLLSWNYSLSMAGIISFTAAAELLSLIPIFVMELKPIRIWQEHLVYTYSEWLSLASGYQHKCRIGLIEFNVTDDNNQILQSAGILKRKMGHNGLVACLDNRTILFMEKKRSDPLTRSEVLILFSGTTRRIWFSELSINGKTALKNANLILSDKIYAPNVLIEKFQKLFSRRAYYMDLEALDEQVAEKFASYERQTIIKEAMRYAKGMTRGSYKFKYVVTAFYPKGKLKYIFLIPRMCEEHRIKEWQAILSVANYQNSLTA